MSGARDKLVEHLGKLIEEGKRLEDREHRSLEVDAWEARCDRALRHVSDREAGEFDAPPNQRPVMHQAGSDAASYWKLLLVLKLNILAAVREDLELFDEEEQNFLDNVKKYWELKAHAGVFSAKIGGGSTKKRR